MNICSDDFINGMTKAILAPNCEINPVPYPLQCETFEFKNNYKS